MTRSLFNYCFHDWYVPVNAIFQVFFSLITQCYAEFSKDLITQRTREVVLLFSHMFSQMQINVHQFKYFLLMHFLQFPHWLIGVSVSVLIGRLNLELRDNEGRVPLWLALSRDTQVDPMDEDSLAAKLVKHGASADAINNITGELPS